METGKTNKGAVFADKVIDRAVYDALCDVFINGAYCARAITSALKTLKEKQSHAFVTSAFYGVLDKNVRLEKLISCLCERAPQKNTAVVLKMGFYYANYADMPAYAAVNRIVELSKSVGGVYSGFVNAVVKKSIGYKPTFTSEMERFSYDHCAPEWLCKMIISDYGETRAAAILDAELPDKTHIRPVAGRSDSKSLAAAAKCRDVDITEYGCYCDKKTLDRLVPGTYAVQSLSSIIAVRAYINGIERGRVLDMCAAPGGKSVLLSESGDFKITACDIYPHKLELMRGYAKKMGAKIDVKLNDATVYNDEFEDNFDVVICDCPCSGTGTLKSKPDLMIRRKPTDLTEINALQHKILDNAARYVACGGWLCYSTCSILKCENEKIVHEFLDAHEDYELTDEVKLMPDTNACDGFYIARLRRK